MELPGPHIMSLGEKPDTAVTPGPTCCLLSKQSCRIPSGDSGRETAEEAPTDSLPPSHTSPGPWAFFTLRLPQRFLPPPLLLTVGLPPPAPGSHGLPRGGQGRAACLPGSRRPGPRGRLCCPQVPTLPGLLGPSPKLKLSGQVPSCPAQGREPEEIPSQP